MAGLERDTEPSVEACLVAGNVGLPMNGKYTAAEVKALLARPKGRVRNVAPRADRTYKGVVYDSKAEALYAFKLDAAKSAGLILGWNRQVRIPLIVEGVKICSFIIDFEVSLNNGNLRYEEIKGWETPEYKLKLKLFKALYPNADYRVVRV